MKSDTLPNDLLERRPGEAARLIALWRLGALVEARPRLEQAGDGEAVHDVRVALRKLRSCLRSHRDLLAGAVRKKTRNTLREIAHASGPARDAEVQLEWLATQPEPSDEERAGVAWLKSRLTDQYEEGGIELRRAFDHRFAKVQEVLELRLSLFVDAVAPGVAPTFREAAMVAVHAHLHELEAALDAAVLLANDMEANHQARIVGKRARYLLEPLIDPLPSWKPVSDLLKSLQEVLGELHDAQVMEQLLASCAKHAPDEAQAGLRTLAVRARQRSEGLFAKLKESRARQDLSRVITSS
jgi:CHAD domain-containing protein